MSARFANWAWRPKPRRALLATSAIGLRDPKPEVFDAARFWFVRATLVAWLSRRVYRDRFFRTVDREYKLFATLPFGAAEKRAINGRVLASIRTIAAFSAWEEVAWAIIEVGLTVACILAAAFGVIGVARALSGNALLPQVLALLVVAIAFFLARSAALAVPRVWPRCALILIVMAAVAASVARLLMAYTDGTLVLNGFTLAAPARVFAIWISVAELALLCVALLWVLFAVVLSISAVFYIRATAKRIWQFPEEEIIQAIAQTLGELYDPRLNWRTAVRRELLIDRLEWVARRFERQFVGRYTGRDPGTDTVLLQTARGCAARVRAQKLMVAFPSEHTLGDLQAFLWSTLQNAALQRWDQIEGEAAAELAPSARDRALSALRGAVAVVAPAGLALAFQSVQGPEAGIKTNVLITGLIWSTLTMLAMLNPKQFEAQASAAKSLGDVLKKSG